jgi:hypothetical protein
MENRAKTVTTRHKRKHQKPATSKPTKLSTCTQHGGLLITAQKNARIIDQD